MPGARLTRWSADACQGIRWLQRIANAAPTAWAKDEINDLFMRERGLLEVLPILGVLFAYGLACLIAGVRLYRFAD